MTVRSVDFDRSIFSMNYSQMHTFSEEPVGTADARCFTGQTQFLSPN